MMRGRQRERKNGYVCIIGVVLMICMTGCSSQSGNKTASTSTALPTNETKVTLRMIESLTNPNRTVFSRV